MKQYIKLLVRILSFSKYFKDLKNNLLHNLFGIVPKLKKKTW